MLSIEEECFTVPFRENPLLSLSEGILATKMLIPDTFKILSVAQSVWTHLLKKNVLRNLKIL